jgi:hypothetical protein
MTMEYKRCDSTYGSAQCKEYSGHNGLHKGKLNGMFCTWTDPEFIGKFPERKLIPIDEYPNQISSNK